MIKSIKRLEEIEKELFNKFMGKYNVDKDLLIKEKQGILLALEDVREIMGIWKVTPTKLTMKVFVKFRNLLKQSEKFK